MRKAYNIKWDTDGDKELLKSLPQEIEIPDTLENEDEISNYITNETGYCHLGFKLEFKNESEVN